MGATARVDLINNRFPSGATENSVLGPFYVETRAPPSRTALTSRAGSRASPCSSMHASWTPRASRSPGAKVDVWHADGDGGYDILIPGVEVAMRGLFRSDAQGRVWFTVDPARKLPDPR
jgi:hydroxyquinol 1,2-dioxygenase